MITNFVKEGSILALDTVLNFGLAFPSKTFKSYKLEAAVLMAAGWLLEIGLIVAYLSIQIMRIILLLQNEIIEAIKVTLIKSYTKDY